MYRRSISVIRDQTVPNIDNSDVHISLKISKVGFMSTHLIGMAFCRRLMERNSVANTLSMKPSIARHSADMSNPGQPLPRYHLEY